MCVCVWKEAVCLGGGKQNRTRPVELMGKLADKRASQRYRLYSLAIFQNSSFPPNSSTCWVTNLSGYSVKQFCIDPNVLAGDYSSVFAGSQWKHNDNCYYMSMFHPWICLDGSFSYPVNTFCRLHYVVYINISNLFVVHFWCFKELIHTLLYTNK